MRKEAFAGIARTEDGTITVIPLGHCDSQLSAEKTFSKKPMLPDKLAVCPITEVETLLKQFKGKANTASMTSHDSTNRRR